VAIGAAHAVQVDEAWRSVVDKCYSRYSKGRVRKGDPPSVMWPRPVAAIEQLVREQSTRDEATDIALAGFYYNDSTGAGLYRGRLSTFYQCGTPLATHGPL
jgi:hypothetical protein